MHERADKFILLGIFLFVLTLITWQRIVARENDSASSNTHLYFLDVGQGDSSLIAFSPPTPGPAVKILIDGGPNQDVLAELEEILPPEDRYIDLIVLTHPQLDHYGGLIDVVKRYRVGAFLFTGRAGTDAFVDLERAITERGIPAIQLLANDRIYYRDTQITAIFPTPQFLTSGELNETSLVLLLEGNNARALFTGDIDAQVENFLNERPDLLAADILKVPHHGSKFSSQSAFLAAVQPKVSVVEVGKNRYGHPTAEALARLQQIGTSIYRTDRDGTVHLILDGERITVKKKL